MLPRQPARYRDEQEGSYIVQWHSFGASGIVLINFIQPLHNINITLNVCLSKPLVSRSVTFGMGKKQKSSKLAAELKCYLFCTEMLQERILARSGNDYKMESCLLLSDVKFICEQHWFQNLSEFLRSTFHLAEDYLKVFFKNKARQVVKYNMSQSFT